MEHDENVCNKKSDRAAWGYALFLIFVVLLISSIIFLKAQGYTIEIEEINSGITLIKI